MGKARVTVIVPTIPGREELLGRCLRSVAAQTLPVEGPYVLCDAPVPGMPAPVHVAEMQNKMLGWVRTPWVMRLADDDWLEPEHVAMLVDWAQMSAPAYSAAPDVYYSFEVDGEIPHYNSNILSPESMVMALAVDNWIDGSACLVRTDTLWKLGGWPTQWAGAGPLDGGQFVKGSLRLAPWEDWALWQLMAKEGAIFSCLAEPTWHAGRGDYPRISRGG